MSSACSFTFMQIKVNHKNGFALSLALKQGHKGTRRWPSVYHLFYCKVVEGYSNIKRKLEQLNLPRMRSGDVTKNSVPLRPAIASFLLTARNDVIFFIFMKDNGTSLTKKKIRKQPLRIYHN